MARTIDGDDVIELSRALQALVAIGVPLDVGLREASAGMSNSLETTARSLADRIKRGESVTEALQAESSLPPVFTAIVTAGFESGATQEILDDVCEVTGALVELRGTVRRGMVYPLIVVGMALFLFALVMPRMIWAQVQIFESVRKEIPAWLASVQSATHWITTENYFIGLAALLALWLIWTMAGTNRGLVSGLRWLPGSGRLLRDADLSRTMHVLGLMLKHGMPLPQALRLAEPASQSAFHRHELRQMADALEHGESFGSVVERQRSLPPFLRWMMAVGVQDSSLASALRQAGDFYQQRAMSRARVLQTLVPALVIGFVAGGVTLLYGATVIGPLQSLWEVIGTAR